MKALTHLAAGGATGAGLALAVGLPLGWETALLAGALGGALPNVEYAFFRLARELRARQKAGPWLEAAAALGQERGPCHGLEFWAGGGALVGAVGFLLRTPAFPLLYLSFLAGWLSHLALDLFNGGIRPLALLRPYAWAYLPPWGRRRVVRGGVAEMAVFLAAGAVWVWRIVELALPWARGVLKRWL